MGIKDGVFLTSVFLMAGAVAGCGEGGSYLVTKDQRFSHTHITSTPPDCDVQNAICFEEETALLSAPSNVVYQTRAHLAKSKPETNSPLNDDTETSNELVNAPEQPDRKN